VHLEIFHGLAAKERDRGLIAGARVDRCNLEALLPRSLRGAAADAELAALGAQRDADQRRSAGEEIGELERRVIEQRVAAELELDQQR
jgi:hypothetical protein